MPSAETLPSRARPAGRGAREHAVEVGDAAVADPGLRAVQHVGVAVRAARCSASPRRRSPPPAPRARRRRWPCPPRPAAASGRAAARRPRAESGALPRPCIAKLKSARPSCCASVSRSTQIERASKSSEAPPSAARRQCRSSPALPRRPTSSRQRRSTSARSEGCVPSVEARRRPAAGLGREPAVPVAEERPLHAVVVLAHQSPSKTGFCFAANAS